MVGNKGGRARSAAGPGSVVDDYGPEQIEVVAGAGDQGAARAGDVEPGHPVDHRLQQGGAAALAAIAQIQIDGAAGHGEVAPGIGNKSVTGLDGAAEALDVLAGGEQRLLAADVAGEVLDVLGGERDQLTAVAPLSAFKHSVLSPHFSLVNLAGCALALLRLADIRVAGEVVWA